MLFKASQKILLQFYKQSKLMIKILAVFYKNRIFMIQLPLLRNTKAPQQIIIMKVPQKNQISLSN